MSHHQGMRRLVMATMLILALGLGAAACGGGNTQGRKQTNLEDLQSKVSSLRLEVESLRAEVQTLQNQVAGTTTTTGPDSSTTTTAPRSTTSTSRA